MPDTSALGLIAGSGLYPFLVARAARQHGITGIHAAAFEGETDPALSSLVDSLEWMRVGQLSRLLRCFSEKGVNQAIMAGQIAPKNLFALRPDLKALLVLGTLRQRNAESIFGAIANELQNVGVRLLSALTFLDDSVAQRGLIAGPKPRRRLLEDAQYGFGVAKQIAQLDIGQTVLVRHGTVLAVEAFEGTNEAIRRAGKCGREQIVMAKVAKPKQDLRFDVPVVGSTTLQVASEAGVALIAVEAAKTLLLDRPAVGKAAQEAGITILGLAHE